MDITTDTLWCLAVGTFVGVIIAVIPIPRHDKGNKSKIAGCNTTDDLCISEADVRELELDKKRIKEICDAGHTNHCAQRQVWGDGECECGRGLK